MTNESIIFQERLRLLENGVIKATGRKIEMVSKDGHKDFIDEPEEIHTYSAWKSYGWQVKKGEHAITKLQIWKHTEKEIEDGEKTEKMFMKTAYFFVRAQCEQAAE